MTVARTLEDLAAQVAAEHVGRGFVTLDAIVRHQAILANGMLEILRRLKRVEVRQKEPAQVPVEFPPAVEIAEPSTKCEDTEVGTQVRTSPPDRMPVVDAPTIEGSAPLEPTAYVSPLAPDDPRHGTHNAYGNLRCRCDRCRAANTAYCLKRSHETGRHTPMAVYLASIMPDHGTKSRYYNHGCRCAECRKSECLRKREERRKRHALGLTSAGTPPLSPGRWLGSAKHRDLPRSEWVA